MKKNLYVMLFIALGIMILGGVASAQLVGETFPSHMGFVDVHFALTVNNAGNEYVVGLCNDTLATKEAELCCSFKLGEDGSLKALNGSAYSADNTVIVAAGDILDVQMTANLITNTYDVYVTTGDGRVTVANDYAFQVATDTLNSVLQTNSADVYVTNMTHDPFADIAMGDLYYDAACGMFQMNCSLVIPELDDMGVVWALTFADSGAKSWLDVGPVLKLNNDFTITARYAGTYMADTTVTYTSGDTIKVDMKVNIPAQSYTVILDKGDGRFPLATDYKFRNFVQTIRNLATYIDVDGYDWSGTAANIVVENLEIHDFLNVPFSDLPALAEVKGQFEAKFKISIDSLGSSGTVWCAGFCDTLAQSWADVGPIFKLNNDFTISARNGNSYSSDVSMTYATGDLLDVQMIMNLVAQTYTVIIDKGEGPVALATDYKFRNANIVANTMWTYMDAESEWGGDPAIITVSELELDDFADIAVGPYANALECTFDLMIESLGDSKGAVWCLGFSDSTASEWGDVGPIFKLNSDYTITARNGSAYSADTTVTYAEGDEFGVTIFVNVFTQTYNIELFNGTGDTIALATNYKFRNPAPIIDNLWVYQDAESEWCGDPANIVINNLETKAEAMPANVWQNVAIAEQDEAMIATFDLSVDSIGAKGIVWMFVFSDSASVDWSDPGPVLKFTKDYILTARNGSTYMAENAITFEQGDQFSVEMSIDVQSQTYSVIVTKNDQEPDILAVDYGFRNPCDVIDNVGVMIDYGATYSGTGDWGIISVTNFEISAGVSDVKDIVSSPIKYELYNNYPNPFNPTTQITYSLAKAGNVNLTIFNAMGQKVVTLIDQSMPAGQHNVTWDGKNYNGQSVAGGVYFCQIKSKNFIQNRKMLLLK